MTPAQQSAQAISYYVDRLIHQFRTKPKARANIAIYVKQMQADDLPWQLQNAFNYPGAVGAQLDTIGKYVGVDRNVGEPIAKPYYSFSDYNGPVVRAHGFTNYNSTQNREAIWLNYFDQGQRTTALTDAAFGFIIALKIVLNSSDGTLYSIQQYLNALLPGLVTVVDNQDMSLTYTISPNAPVSATVLLPFLPKPMGVRLIVEQFGNLITDTGDAIVTDTGDHVVVPGL